MARPVETPQDKKNKMIVAANLNSISKSRNVKQVDISKRTGIPKSTLTGYFKGTSLPTPGNVQKLADFFNIFKSDIDPRFLDQNDGTNINIQTTINNIIGSRIRTLRLTSNLSQSELADKLSVSKQTVSNWETGLKVPRMAALKKMSDLFDVSIGYITDGDTTGNVVNLSNNPGPYVIKTDAIMRELNEMYQKRVYSYAKEQFDNQKMAFPDTLAAHQADPNHKITDQEAKDIGNYLDGEIDKYNSDK